MQEQIGNVSREMDTSGKKLKRNSSNKNPHNVTEKKDAFHALMNRISGRGSISELESMSTETQKPKYKGENKRIKRAEKNIQELWDNLKRK